MRLSLPQRLLITVFYNLLFIIWAEHLEPITRMFLQKYLSSYTSYKRKMSLMVQIGEYKTTHNRIHIKILTRDSLHSNLLFDALPLPHPIYSKE